MFDIRIVAPDGVFLRIGLGHLLRIEKCVEYRFEYWQRTRPNRPIIKVDLISWDHKLLPQRRPICIFVLVIKRRGRQRRCRRAAFSRCVGSEGSQRSDAGEGGEEMTAIKHEGPPDLKQETLARWSRRFKSRIQACSIPRYITANSSRRMLLSSRMKAEPLNTTNAEHYIWGEACDGWHLVRSQELSIIEERMPPNTAERRHFHSKADQFFYIRSGEAQMEIEGQIIILSTRNGIFIAHGQRHKISNKCDQDVTFLVISRPTTRGDREECS